MKIRTSDLTGVIEPYRSEIDLKIKKVIDSGIFIGGEEVQLFEEYFSKYIQSKHTVSTGSGTDALQLALRSLGISKDDFVATVSHTAVATVAAIDMVGANPVFVDIDPATFTIDPVQLEKTVGYYSENPFLNPIKAVIAVHLYGHPAPMIEIMKLAAKYDFVVIEDCSQAHGAEIDGIKCGNFGHVSAFSFYPTKNLGCLGDGGALCTSIDEVAESARLIKEYGWKERYISHVKGINTRLDTIQAAILTIRLRYLEGENEKRIANATRYLSEIKSTLIQLPTIKPGYKHVFHQFVILTPDREKVIEHLDRHGIGSSVLYPKPVHLQPAYQKSDPTEHKELPVSEKICHELLCLPVHPALSEDDVDLIISIINSLKF